MPDAHSTRDLRLWAAGRPEATSHRYPATPDDPHQPHSLRDGGGRPRRSRSRTGSPRSGSRGATRSCVRHRPTWTRRDGHPLATGRLLRRHDPDGTFASLDRRVTRPRSEAFARISEGTRMKVLVAYAGWHGSTKGVAGGDRRPAHRHRCRGGRPARRRGRVDRRLRSCGARQRGPQHDLARGGPGVRRCQCCADLTIRPVWLSQLRRRDRTIALEPRRTPPAQGVWDLRRPSGLAGHRLLGRPHRAAVGDRAGRCFSQEGLANGSPARRRARA